MKMFNFITKQICLAGALALVFVAASGFKADPTDDFSFSYARSPVVDGYKLMSANKIEAILSDRLDLFPDSQAGKLARHLVTLCKRYRFDPAFVLSLIEVESSFRVSVISPAGAIGLMQLMPETAAIVAKWYNIKYSGGRALVDPFTNLSLGIAYLSYLRDKYRELSPYFHIAAYNIGPARLDELLARKYFKPTKTKKYYEAIKQGVPVLRYFRSRQSV